MNKDTVAYLLKMGSISFTEDELERLTDGMAEMAAVADTVKAVELPENATVKMSTVRLGDLRADRKEESMENAKLLSNAKTVNNCFVVPKVLE